MVIKKQFFPLIAFSGSILIHMALLFPSAPFEEVAIGVEDVDRVSINLVTVIEEQNVNEPPVNNPKDQSSESEIFETVLEKELNQNSKQESDSNKKSATENSLIPFDQLSSSGHTPSPPYPSIARQRKYNGTVILKITIAADGSVITTEIITSSGFPILDRAAQNTVNEKWHFSPLGRVITTEKRFVFELR